jgi:hypothetical protein
VPCLKRSRFAVGSDETFAVVHRSASARGMSSPDRFIRDTLADDGAEYDDGVIVRHHLNHSSYGIFGA